MLSSYFQQKLKQLNKDLHIYCGNNPNRPAGIYHIVKGEYMDICGIDKNYVPQYSITEANGNILTGGWRRALKILIGQGLINRKEAEQVFYTRLHYKGPKKKKPKRSTPLGRRLA